MKRKKLSIIMAAVMVTVMLFSGVANAAYLHTSGNKIVDANGKSASLSGLSWFGFETSNYAPHGLWANSMSALLDVVKNNGFNHLRVPYCSQMFDSGSAPNGIDYNRNPDLQGLSSIQVMDKLVDSCKARGLAIYLDRHRPDSGGQSELWYTSAYDETRWINDWKMLASRYKGNDTVVGCDLHNEPHGKATWGSGDTTTDWRLAAQRCGNAILSVNSDLLIIVEGNDSFNGNGYWWGGNLMGVQNYPVTLDVANRVVYSPHDYGPGVANQSWFSDPNFPNNLPSVWDKYWGYISKNNIAPILVGEFGGRSYDTSSTEGKWQNALVNYIKSNGMNWTYWCLNPNSGDTGGILSDDWATVVSGKISMLKPAMYPMLGSGGTVSTPTPTPSTATPTPTPSTATPTPTPSTATATPTPSGATPTPTPSTATPTPTPTAGTPAPGGIKVQFFNGNTTATTNTIYPCFKVVNTGTTSVNLSDVKMRYYFTNDGTAADSFACDYSTIGTGNVTSSFATIAKTNADRYLEVGFTSAAGTLAAGAGAEVKGRIWKSDWSNFTQTNDYSFNATATNYVDSAKTTGYISGALKWGTEP